MTKPYNKIVIRNLTVMMSVGIHAFEKTNLQRVIVNAEITVPYNQAWKKDDIETVLSYAEVVEQIENIARSQHMNLVETFAERIASMALGYAPVIDVRVRIEKPDIFENIDGIGVEIFRTK